MRATNWMLMAVLSVGLLGCGSEPPPPAKETVFDDQLKALEKAKAVEKQALEQAQRQREQIDAMSEASPVESTE